MIDKVTDTNDDYVEDLTGEIKLEDESMELVGDRIKKLREDKSISIEELANLTGFEVDLLKKIESKEFQPQLGTVLKLSKALDSAFGKLISGVGSALYSITRDGEQKNVARSTSHKEKKQIYSYKSLAPEVKGRNMESLMVKLEEKVEGATPLTHNGEEFIYVTEGVVEITIGDETFDLNKGDSIYYLSTTPHLVSAKSGTATIIAVLYAGE